MSGQAEVVAAASPATETVVAAAPAAETAAPSIPILLPAASSLYVGDLAQEITETDLFNHFSTAGTVALVRVCRDATRRKSLGYAYVNFLTSQDAEKALTQLNGSLIKGRPCRVLWSQRDASVRKSGVGNVFIKNLAKTADIKALNDLFAPYGKITSSKIAFDHHLRSLGHAFVNFSTQEEADAAIAALNNTVFQEKQLFVVKFVPKSERVFPETPIAPVQAAPLTTSSPPPAAIFQKPLESFTNIFIKNLGADVTEDKIKEVFGVFGEIESAVVARYLDGNLVGKPKGFGFVNFQLHENAVAALEAMNNKSLVEGGKPLVLSKYMKKAEREAQKFKNPQPHRHHNHRHHHNNQQRNHHRVQRINNNNNGQVIQGQQQPQRRYHHHNNRNNNGHQQNVPQHHQGARVHHNRRHHNQQQQGINLYVKGFEPTVTEQILKDSFVAFGSVLGTRVMKDETGASRGFGFVTLKTAEEAQKAVAEMNGQRIQASQVTVAIAHRKEHNHQGRRHGNHRNGKRHFNKRNNQQKQAVAVAPAAEQSLEEKVYYKLEAINAELAGQITGMIIEEYSTNGASLQELLVNDTLLKEKYSQALEVLNAATAAAASPEASAGVQVEDSVGATEEKPTN